MMFRFSIGKHLLALLALGTAPLAGQELPALPLGAAVRYELTERALLTERGMARDDVRIVWREALSAEAREWVSEAAKSVGALSGSIEALLACQPGRPPPEMFKRGWCRLPEEVQNLVLVGEPKRTDVGWEIPITTFTAVQAPPDRYSLYSIGGTVLVSRASEGHWSIEHGAIREHAQWP
jgi:hypothetical protein